MYRLFLLWLGCFCIVSSSAYAQNAQQEFNFFINDAVYSDNQLEQELLQYNQKEYRPQLQYHGIDYGFSVFNTTRYDTNIFSAGSDSAVPVEQDWINRTGFAASVGAKILQHSLGANIGFSDERYVSNSSEDAQKFNFDAAGRLSLSHNDTLSLRAVYKTERERRDDILSPQISQERIALENKELNLTYNKALRRTRFSLSTGAIERDYQDGTSDTGVNIEQDFRDFKRYALQGRVDYAISPEISILSLIEANKTDANNNSHGVNYAAGFNANITDLINMETKIGYFVQYFDNPAFQNTEGLLLDTNLTYYVTPLTELSLDLLFDRDQQAFVNGSDSLRKQVSLGLDHKLTRYVTLYGRTNFIQQDFGQSDASTYRFETGAEYLVGDHIALELKNTFSFQKTSNLDVSRDFDKNVTMIGLQVRY